MDNEPLVTSDVLWAVSKLLLKECSAPNQAYIRCKQADNNPAACLEQGRATTACTLSVVRRCQENCAETFEAYRGCVKTNYEDFNKCRKQQVALDRCWADAKKAES